MTRAGQHSACAEFQWRHRDVCRKSLRETRLSLNYNLGGRNDNVAIRSNLAT
jgi:hypothetical protein